VPSIFKGWKSCFSKKWFDFRARGIYSTPRVVCDSNSPVVVLSQLHSPDLTMYLLAAKSFARFLPPKEFVVVDDGLAEGEKELLSQHLGVIRFIPVHDCNSSLCPSGGCWERILSIAKLNATDHVIQLDADTLTLASPDEVIACVEDNRSFTLGTWGGRETMSLTQASEFASQHPGEHVQILAETAMGKFPDAELKRYVRGCAGFAGFARNTMTVEDVETFSQQMVALIGNKKWSEWGSEQVTSNYIVANSPNPVILPVEKYPFWAPGLDVSEAKFLHFVGSYRFAGECYINSARQIIFELNTK
jgi:hypothetical protein